MSFTVEASNLAVLAHMILIDLPDFHNQITGGSHKT